MMKMYNSNMGMDMGTVHMVLNVHVYTKIGLELSSGHYLIKLFENPLLYLVITYG